MRRAWDVCLCAGQQTKNIPVDAAYMRSAAANSCCVICVMYQILNEVRKILYVGGTVALIEGRKMIGGGVQQLVHKRPKQYQ